MNKKTLIIAGLLLAAGLVYAAAQTKFYTDILMNSHKITGVVMSASDTTSVATKGYVDTNLSSAVSGYLPLSGGTMSGAVNMGSSKITSLATPTAAADATTKAYVDTLVGNAITMYDSFLFYTLSGATTNEARIFNVASTGGYVRVAMLADNAGGTQNKISAVASQASDTVSVVRTETTFKAGNGFKLWLTSDATNDHYTSVKVRDGGDGGGVFLAKVKYVNPEAPDWDLYIATPPGVTNSFNFKYTGEALYDIRNAYYSGILVFRVGVSNITSRTISCSISADASKFTETGSYGVEYPSGTTYTVSPGACQYYNVYVQGYDDTKGASIVIQIANGELMTTRIYKTFFSWGGPQ